MLNESVVHSKFGEGKIVEINNNHIKIAFQDCDGVKIFLYPDSFEKFLAFQNKTMQHQAMVEIDKLNQVRIQVEEEKRQEIIKQELERKKERLELMKKKKRVVKKEKTVSKKLSKKGSFTIESDLDDSMESTSYSMDDDYGDTIEDMN